MKTKFALPSESDMRFVRQSGFRADDFPADKPKIGRALIDGLVVATIFLGILALHEVTK